MRIISQLSAAVADPLANIPWGAQLGMVGTLVLIIVGILIRHNRQVQKDAQTAIDRAYAQKDLEYQRMETLLNNQIVGLGTAVSEWRSAHEISEKAREVERETTRNAVQSNGLFDLFAARVVEDLGEPRSGGTSPSTAVPRKGDNGGKEASQ